MINKTKEKANFSITVLLIIGIAIVMNFFSYQLFYRWDLTEAKSYSVSKVTKKTVKDLEDIVSIKAYFSETLPSQFISVKQEVKDILDEYQNYSNGKVRVEFIDPGDDENTQSEMAMKGIPQLTFQVTEKDKLQLVKGYMGIAISYGDKNEVIPAVDQNTSDLEYQLTTAIKKVTSSDVATIGFLTGYGAPDAKTTFSVAYKELQKLYTIKDVAITDKEGVPTDVKTLIIAGPKEEMKENVLKAVNEFVARGGSLLVLEDGAVIEQGLNAKKNTSGLEKLLEKYGLKLNTDLVGDVSNGVASFSQGFFSFSTNYPFWPKVTKDGFAQNSAIVSSLENVILPWASSIDVDATKINEQDVTRLAQTTNKAWDLTESFNIAPNNIEPGTATKQFTLAASANGEVSNPYATKDKKQGDKMNIRLAVVGDSDFLYDNFVNGLKDNLTFFQNLVDSLTLDEDLIAIRSKNVSSSPIKQDLSDGSKMALRYGNVFGLTLIVIIFGITRYFMRRRSRFVDEI